ncbi:MAG: class I SAM-dependent methyltransferase [Saprospiraceae bacterium]
MKIRPVIILFSICLFGLFLACKLQSNPNDRDETASPSDTSGETVEFDTEIKEYESADRVIWQKPDLVIDQLGNVEGKVVADLGAGTGYFSRRIAYKGATVIAIDIDPKAILWMEEQRSKFPPELREKLIIRQAEPDNPHLNPNEVDIVLLVNTYSYIANRVEYFKALQKSIRPRGSVVIIDFKKKETPFGPPLEERVAEADVEKELREAGYDIVRMDVESLEYQYIIKATRN